MKKYQITVPYGLSFFPLAKLRHEARLFGFWIKEVHYEYPDNETVTITAICEEESDRA